MKALQSTFMYALLALCGVSQAQAQTIYRLEKPNGSITFTDRLPIDPEHGKLVATGTGAHSVASTVNLPFELKQVVSKYPVTLYTAPLCAPCDNAKTHLSARGVPFSERTVTTTEDSTQLQRLSGDGSLPYLTIGSQRVKGFSASELTQYLDAAGYPANSMLPAGYKNAAASPLAPIAVVAAPKPAKKETPITADTPATTSSNPAGITF